MAIDVYPPKEVKLLTEVRDQLKIAIGHLERIADKLDAGPSDKHT